MLGQIFVLHIAGFFVGAIPCGYLIGKCFGVDIREHGSGNVGATNISRTLGRAPGIITFICDVVKGAAASSLVYLSPDTSSVIEALAPSVGFCSIFGHCYSPFLMLRGGKGVATSFGVFVVISPVLALTAVVIFAVLLKTTRYVSLSSMISVCSFPVLIYVTGGGNQPAVLMLAACLTASLIVLRHRSNIKRLIDGNEPKIQDKGIPG